MAKTRDFEKLHEGFAELVLALILKVQEAGYRVKINEGVRSMARQAALYAKGRTRPGRKVTNAKPGESMHNFNLAVDLCLEEAVIENGKPTFYPDKHPVWEAIGKAAREVGLVWGGDWKTIKDRPHVEMPIKLQTIQALYRKGGLDSVYDLADAQVELLKKKAEIAKHAIEPNAKIIPLAAAPLSVKPAGTELPLMPEAKPPLPVTFEFGSTEGKGKN